MSSVCPEGQPPPVAVVHCNDLRSEHRYSVIAVRPPIRDQSPSPEDLPASLADVRHSTAEETSNPGGRSPSRCREGTCWAVTVDGPRGRPIPQDGQPNSEAGLVIHHSWRRALTQCRARFHISSHPRGWPVRMLVHSFRHGDWSLPTIPLGIAREPVRALPLVADARRSLSWTPLRGVDASAGIRLALRAQTCRTQRR
jgi:hypothetical protein